MESRYIEDENLKDFVLHYAWLSVQRLNIKEQNRADEQNNLFTREKLICFHNLTCSPALAS